jgi:hypothetical protein
MHEVKCVEWETMRSDNVVCTQEGELRYTTYPKIRIHRFRAAEISG